MKGNIFAILPGRDVKVGSFETGWEMGMLVRKAELLGATGVSVHGTLAKREVSGEMSFKDAYLMARCAI